MAKTIEARTYEEALAWLREHGFDVELVKSVIRMVERNEYKRQQAAPGIKISPKAFGYGRRLPIAAKADI